MTENIYKLNTRNWQHKLNSIGGIVTDADDIEQCYEVIFKTPKGSVVLNPNIGWDFMQYLGKPLNLVESKMRSALLKELNLQEPRAVVTSIKFSYGSADDFAAGHLSVEIEYIIFSTNEAYRTGIITL